MNNKNKSVDQQPPFYRFEIFKAIKTTAGKLIKTKDVGMAFLRPGDPKYGVKLFTFSGERFFLVPDQRERTTFRIQTVTRNRAHDSKRKFIWNIVGCGKVDTTRGVIVLKFHLLPCLVYMSIFPLKENETEKMPKPVFYNEAA